jgi:hypothetical protein
MQGCYAIEISTTSCSDGGSGDTLTRAGCDLGRQSGTPRDRHCTPCPCVGGAPSTAPCASAQTRSSVRVGARVSRLGRLQQRTPRSGKGTRREDEPPPGLSRFGSRPRPANHVRPTVLATSGSLDQIVPNLRRTIGSFKTPDGSRLWPARLSGLGGPGHTSRAQSPRRQPSGLLSRGELFTRMFRSAHFGVLILM